MRLGRILRNAHVRHWTREIIVIGVLVTLGIGNLAQDLDWAKKRREARAALQRELVPIDDASAERVLADCVGRRLDQLEAVLDRASVTGRPATIRARTGPVQRAIRTSPVFTATGPPSPVPATVRSWK